MVDKTELNEELRRSLAEGAMTDRFAVLAEECVRGWYSKRSATGWSYAVDDIVLHFMVRLARHWRKLDPKRNPFAALTTMGRRCGMDWQRSEVARKRREALA